MHSLCIIDMQYEFEAALADWLRPVILQEIGLCKKNNWPIIIVRYGDRRHGRYTYESDVLQYIRDATARYPKLIQVGKNDDDGSLNILRSIRRSRIHTNNVFRIVGVNTDCCVQETICGLVSCGCKVEVVRNGCWTEAKPSYHKNALKHFRKIGIRILRNKYGSRRV